jgi:hypothetical protein
MATVDVLLATYDGAARLPALLDSAKHSHPFCRILTDLKQTRREAELA